VFKFIKNIFMGREPSINEKLASNCKSDPLTPLSLFKNLTKDELKWIFLNQGILDSAVKETVPSMPPEQMQLNWTGLSGDACLTQALNFVEVIYDVSNKYGNRINSSTTILDFGCGWGRIIRFFMADVQHENLFGIDCYAEALAAARLNNKWCQFTVSNIMPPTVFEENSFDIIYLYSVFSHLSEKAHKLWLNEFHRLLKPKGLLIATTRPREIILACKRLRENKRAKEFETGMAQSFLDSDAAITDYDEGRFCFAGTGGGGPLDPSFYGEACISKKYVENNWSDKFNLLDYKVANTRVDQNIICCAKR